MQTTKPDEFEDGLIALVGGELTVNLIAAVVLILHALHETVRASWAPPAIVFVASAVGLLVTSAVADFRRRLIINFPQGPPPLELLC